MGPPTWSAAARRAGRTVVDVQALLKQMIDEEIRRRPVRRSAVACVACHLPMAATSWGWECPDGGRLWRLDAVEARHAGTGRWLRLEAVGEAQRGRACPQCRDAMTVIRDTEDAVPWRLERLDVCLACDTVWADAGELELEHE